MGKTPNHPFVHRVLEPLFSPSILGPTPIVGNIHIYIYMCSIHFFVFPVSRKVYNITEYYQSQIKILPKQHFLDFQNVPRAPIESFWSRKGLLKSMLHRVCIFINLRKKISDFSFTTRSWYHPSGLIQVYISQHRVMVNHHDWVVSLAVQSLEATTKKIDQ